MSSIDRWSVIARISLLQDSRVRQWGLETCCFQHSLYECADFWLLVCSRARYIESRDCVLADELQERSLWTSGAFMEMQPRLVVFDREIDRFL